MPGQTVLLSLPAGGLHYVICLGFNAVWLFGIPGSKPLVFTGHGGDLGDIGYFQLIFTLVRNEKQTQLSLNPGRLWPEY